jgi:hypothetical protein
MKIFFQYMVVATLLCTGSGCKKFLSTQPADFITPGNYYTTREHIIFALNGVYDILGNRALYQYQMLGRMGLEADEGFYNRAAVTTGLPVYVFDPSDAELTNHWRMLYEGINRANLLLDNVDKPSMDDSERQVIRGEAMFLRAYFYFLLVTTWGDVPLILEPSGTVTGHSRLRTPSTTVYEQIVTDMEAAEKLVLGVHDIRNHAGRVSRSAVAGVLARVYLHWAGYPLRDETKYLKAREWASVVMDPDNGHTLLDSYEQVFINYARDLYDLRESIWEVEFQGNGMDIYTEYGHVGNVNGIASPAGSEIGYSTALLNATQRLYNLYEEGDTRRDWAIAPFRYAGTEKVYWGGHQLFNRNCGKWRREYETLLPKTNHGTPQNFPLLRFSDVLLMFAEAENFINGPTEDAHEALNTVRRRANASPFGGNSRITDKTIFDGILMDERSRELCFETLRKGDLIRKGRFIQAMKGMELELRNNGGTFAFGALAGSNVSSRHLLYPIPTRELSLNRALTQNPGW